jgi:hypothetical protein
MRKQWKRIALAVTLAMVAPLVGAWEASAAPGRGKLCWWDSSIVHCVDIEIVMPWDKYLECWMCGFSFLHRYDPVIRAEVDASIGEQVTKGLSKLGEAQLTQDEAVRARLRTEALDAFTASARHGTGSTMKLRSAGIANPEKNTFVPSTYPWLIAAGEDVADGVTLLQRSFSDPANAARLQSLAVAQFDEAYQELSEQVATGS